MMPSARLAALERHLAPQLQPVLTELRMIDPVTFIDHVVNGRRAVVERMVADAAELHFAPGFIAYDGDANVDADWTGPPSVALTVRIAAPLFDARVRLTIRDDAAAIEFQNVEPPAIDAEQVRRAMERNRITRLARARPVA